MPAPTRLTQSAWKDAVLADEQNVLPLSFGSYLAYHARDGVNQPNTRTAAQDLRAFGRERHIERVRSAGRNRPREIAPGSDTQAPGEAIEDAAVWVRARIPKTPLPLKRKLP